MPIGARSSPVTYATTKLTYPIFDAEFDPYDRGYLVVAGGGGENRTGVPNKLTLLDVSSREAVTPVTEVDLSTDEDSPQSLASLATKQGLISLVGISSSLADQKAGKNEHLRSFDVEFPPKKRAKTEHASTSEGKGARIAPAGKAALFKPPTAKSPKTYQRILRLSPVGGRDVASKRIGAIATADATENEIVLFDATTFLPNSSSVLQRLALDGEAEDLDLIEYSAGSFGLAYCTGYQVCMYNLQCNFSKKTSTPASDPITIHTIPKPADGPRPKIRCIRWISPKHLVLLQNTQPGGSPELVILEADAKSGTSRIVQRKSLSKSMGIGIRLAVCLLDGDPSSGERQILLAAAGQNKSIYIVTLSHRPSATDQLTDMHKFTTLNTSDQHSQSISKIAFSNFFPPKQPIDATMSVASETQYVQLVSVSVGYTVSVETFALTSIPTSPSLTSSSSAANKKTASRPSVRWVLSTRQSEFLRSWFGLYVAAFAILVIGILTQQYLATNSMAAGNFEPVTEIYSKIESLGSPVSVPTNFDSRTSSAASVVSSIASTMNDVTSSAVAKTEHKLLDLLHIHKEHLSGDNPSKAILMSAPENPFTKSNVAAQLHHDIDEARKQGAKTFEELTEREKEKWLKRLVDTGHWSEQQPMAILKSVLFAEYAGIVGGAIRDAVLS